MTDVFSGQRIAPAVFASEDGAPAVDWDRVDVVDALLPLVIGLVGVCLMATAYVLLIRRGGWRHAMDPPARWERLPHRLVGIGAHLGVLFAILVAVRIFNVSWLGEVMILVAVFAALCLAVAARKIYRA